MIRVALLSRDVKLQPLLAPALGREYQMITKIGPDEVKSFSCDSGLDVILLDIDSEFCLPGRQMEMYSELSESAVPVVVLTDDIARPVAVDLVQRGAHSYCRKPPALLELRAAIQRACEHTAMKRQLQARSAPGTAKPDMAEPLRCDALIGSSPERCRRFMI